MEDRVMSDILSDIYNGGTKRLFYCSSMYHILIASSIILSLGDKENNFVVICPSAKPMDSIEHYGMILKRLQEVGIQSCIIDKKSKIMRFFRISDIINYRRYKEVRKQLCACGEEYLLVNFSWDQQVVRYPASIFFKKCKKTIFIEEGVTQYVISKCSSLYIMALNVYGNQTKWWNNSKVDKIYVHYPERFSDFLQHKLRQFSFMDIYYNWKENKYKELLSIFMQKNEQDKLLELKKKERTCIIFTQPLSEDGIVAEKEKIRIYRELARFYARYGYVYIKVHPRDRTKYQIENAIVMQGIYPSELFICLGIKFTLAIGLCTSAIETVDAAKRCNLNERFLLEKRFEMIDPDKIPPGKVLSMVREG